MLARLGRAPVRFTLCLGFPFYSCPTGQYYVLFDAIKNGAGFFFSDNDYLKHPDVVVKRETPSADTVPSWAVKNSSTTTSIEPASFPSFTSNPVPTRKRLHRSAAATVKSYAYAHSDSDDDPTGHHDAFEPSSTSTTRTVESNLQLWIKHLSALQKDETKKVRASVSKKLSTILLTFYLFIFVLPVQREEAASRAIQSFWSKTACCQGAS